MAFPVCLRIAGFVARTIAWGVLRGAALDAAIHPWPVQEGSDHAAVRFDLDKRSVEV